MGVGENIDTRSTSLQVICQTFLRLLFIWISSHVLYIIKADRLVSRMYFCTFWNVMASVAYGSEAFPKINKLKEIG